MTAVSLAAAGLRRVKNECYRFTNWTLRFKILDPSIDTSNEIGQFIFTVLASVAQLERGMMLARQREGVAKAKREGKYMGRKPTAREKADQVKALAAEGLGAVEIAKRLNIGRVSVWRILNGTPEAEAEMQGRVKAWPSG